MRGLVGGLGRMTSGQCYDETHAPVSSLELLVVLSFLGLVLWGLVRAARRQVRLFVVEVQGGQVVTLSGRMPKRLLDDLSDIFERQQVPSLRLTCELERGEAALSFKGEVDPGVRQMVRNVVGQYPAMRLRQAPPIGRK